jgi:RNAse (barnase) inhibitor barstar
LSKASPQQYIQLVETIALNGSRWENASDFYEAYLAAVGAPEWHGRNLDPLWDSLIGGDINQRNPPFHVQISGTAQMGDGARELVKRFKALIAEARAAGHSVDIELLP